MALCPIPPGALALQLMPAQTGPMQQSCDPVLPSLYAGTGPGAAFQQLLDEARQRDIATQQAVENFARGEDPGRIHEVMVAATKAEISLRTLATVRNKLMDAWRELERVTS